MKIEPALEEWLKPYQKTSGPVVQFTESWFRKLLRGTKKAPKETDSPACQGLFRLAQVAPPDNALRHSFASYWLAWTGAEGVGKLAIQLGDSESVAKRHYIESLMPIVALHSRRWPEMLMLTQSPLRRILAGRNQ